MSFYLKGMANYIVSAAVLFTVSASLFGSKIDNFPGSFKLGDLNNTNCIACKAVVDTVLDVGIAHFKKNITDAAIKACNFFVYIKLPHIDESVCEQYVYAYEVWKNWLSPIPRCAIHSSVI